MANPKLKIPSDSNSELYFDAKKLTVGFRTRRSEKPAGEIAGKVLRVVIQCFGWVIDDRIFDAGTVITAGANRKNLLRIPTKDLPEFHPLIEYTADGSVRLLVNAHFTGVLQSGNKLEPLTAGSTKEPMRSIVLPRGSRGVLEHGNVLIYFEEVAAPSRIPPPALFKNLGDPYFVRWLLISLAAHLMILLIVKIMPTPPKEVTLEDLSPEVKKIVLDAKRFAKFTPPPTSGISASNLSRGPVGMEGEGERAPGQEGRRGRGVPGSGRMSGKDIGRTGVLDFFSKGGNRNVLSDLVGGSAVPGNVESAFNRNARYGLPGETELRSGKGLQGTGTGGGGLSTSIGQGLGTKGKGGGAKGPGLADFGTGRSGVAVSASIDEEEVYITGNIPKEVIAKIMRDNQGAIQFCYQRQVQVQPDLRGKIVTDFIIGLEGRVTSSKIKQTTMMSKPVEDCISNVIRRIQFPKPGGGVVEVVYPYLFRVAG